MPVPQAARGPVSLLEEPLAGAATFQSHLNATKGWSAGDGWFLQVSKVFKKHGCKWGGDWTSPDPPHFQWAPCKASPSDVARALMRTKGVEEVWRVVGALA